MPRDDSHQEHVVSTLYCSSNPPRNTSLRSASRPRRRSLMARWRTGALIMLHWLSSGYSKIAGLTSSISMRDVLLGWPSTGGHGIQRVMPKDQDWDWGNSLCLSCWQPRCNRSECSYSCLCSGFDLSGTDPSRDHPLTELSHNRSNQFPELCACGHWNPWKHTHNLDIPIQSHGHHTN